MSCSQEIAEQLRERGFRMTPQRHTIIHILKASNRHLSPAEVYAQARQSVPGLTEATVYRTLDFLAQAGVLQPALNGSRHLVYEIAGHAHHHLVCSSCGAGLEIPPDPLDRLFQALESESGYRLSANHLTLFGLCPACQAG